MRARLDRIESEIKARSSLNKQHMFVDCENKTITIKDDNGEVIRYYTSDAAPTVRKFNDDNTSLHKLIMGPRGSSKSTGCCVDGFFRLKESSPCRDGVKRARWLISRNTYGDLRTTTIPTFSHWFGLPELNWKITMAPPINASLEYFDGEYMNKIEILFVSFDKEDSAKKARSMELTMAYFNECSEICTVAMDETTPSVGRYPHKSDKIEGGNYWFGMIYDTNAFATYHPLYTKYIVEKPRGHTFYCQPGGLLEQNPGVFDYNPNAENIVNLPDHYYENAALGKTKEFVRTRICNQFGNYEEGKKCHPEYETELHSAEKIELTPGHPIYMAFDYGGTNACVIAQYIGGQLLLIRELMSATKSLREFLATDVQGWIETEGYGYEIKFPLGDPANNYSHENAHYSHEIVENVLGFRPKSAPTNEIKARLDAVDQFLLKSIAGVGRGLLVSRLGCPVLHAGLAGKYKLKLVKTATGVAPIEKPDKNTQYSHPNDCLQYIALEILRRRTERPRVKWSTPRRVI